MAVAQRDSACQLSSSFVILFGNSLDRMAKVAFEFCLEFNIGVL
jgi:hypothetical protein